MEVNSLICAGVPLRNYSLTHSLRWNYRNGCTRDDDTINIDNDRPNLLSIARKRSKAVHRAILIWT